MKKTLLIAASAALILASCGGQKGQKTANAGDSTATPEYQVVNKDSVDLSKLPVDKDGFITLFDGKTLTGWRGYGMDTAPKAWGVEDGAIKLKGSGTGEGHGANGGDLIFSHKFKNFQLELEYKISKGGNSGIFYLAQEVTTKKDGKDQMEPIFISAPEYQVLDNANHPDAQLGKDGDRQAASLYDMEISALME